VSKVREAIKKQAADLILFTGDYIRDGLLLAKLLSLPVYGVAGNCDPSGAGEKEQVIEFNGFKFFLTHGHHWGVKRGLQSLFYRTQEVGAQVAVFGHTHVPFCQKIDDIWMINPGSPAYPRGISHRGTYAIVRIEDNNLHPEILKL
jgi:putative phosphoesterase